jgi:hypothetical protein
MSITFIILLVFWKIPKLGWNVSAEDEAIGLDISEHGESAYVLTQTEEDLVEQMPPLFAWIRHRIKKTKKNELAQQIEDIPITTPSGDYDPNQPRPPGMPSEGIGSSFHQHRIGIGSTVKNPAKYQPPALRIEHLEDMYKEMMDQRKEQELQEAGDEAEMAEQDPEYVEKHEI